MDGVGEWATTSAWVGKGNEVKPHWELSFPHSLGLLYSAFTFYCGFKVNSGEYKLMGLAPYGEPKYVDMIYNNLIDVKPDGTFRLNLRFFKFHRGFRMTSQRFHALFGQPPRDPESDLEPFHMDLAASIQVVTENIVLALARSLIRKQVQKFMFGWRRCLELCGQWPIAARGAFENIWIQPASGDAGISLGAALVTWHQHLRKTRPAKPLDAMQGTYLGPSFSNQEICSYLESQGIPFRSQNDEQLFNTVATLLEQGKVVGWFNGRMEFGPRSLGARSILGDPRSQAMQSVMNLKIKYRESSGLLHLQC